MNKARFLDHLAAEIVVYDLQFCTKLVKPPVAVASNPLRGVPAPTGEHRVVLSADGADPGLHVAHVVPALFLGAARR